MRILNEMKLSFVGRSANESFARVAVAAFFAQLDPTVEEITEIKTVVSEAVTNSIVHAYGSTIGGITIKARILEGNMAEISVEDKGCGIEDIKKAMMPLYTTCETGERSGMGFTIMESFTDYIKVFSKCGKGTRVKMRKKLTQR